MCVCSLRYLVCNAHVPYCHLLPAPLCRIFLHYLINSTIFEKKKRLLHAKCVFRVSLQLVFVTFFSLRRIRRDIIKMYIGHYVECPLFLSNFNEAWIFWDRFSKNTKIPSIVKIRPVWKPSCSMRTDWRTDTTKLRVAFRNFANAPEKLKGDFINLKVWREV